MKIHGSFVAIVTPFNSKGQLDVLALERIVEWQIREGTDGIICSGATGESVCLNASERERILKVCLQISRGRVPIISGTGTPNTKETVLLTEKAMKAGAAACLVITPFYNKPSARGCVLHFKEVAKAGPIIAYHNPARTMVRLSVDSLAEMGAIKGVVGLKEASGDLELIRALRKISSLPILSGDDWLTFETIRAGGVGAISTIGNIVPRAWKEMIWLSLTGDWDRAKGISERFQALCRALFSETNPQCVKYALSLMGKCKSTLRLPLVEPLEENQLELKRVLLRLSLPFKSLSMETRLF